MQQQDDSRSGSSTADDEYTQDQYSGLDFSGKKKFVKKNDEEKYKTELCKNFVSTGKCNYGKKCRFAHGKDELV